jgi:peptide deformylase
MVLPIVKYGHPALRRKGARIAEITSEVRTLITDMLETMYDSHGVGLAAQQVGRPLQLTVIDVSAAKDRPSTLEINGEAMDVASIMPLILINPELKPVGDPVEGPEGCLSFPEIYADISRPAKVDVIATNQKGEQVAFRCGGLLARAVQHETDHLNGVLFIDRMATAKRRELSAEIDELQARTKALMQQKKA